ncbi:MAG: serine hydrolase [Planctomycetota bacterium]
MSFRFLSTTAVLLLFAASLAAQDADPRGRWEGTIEGIGLAFDVDLAREGEVWSGDISIPAQGLVDRGLREISFAEGTLRFEIDGIPGKPRFEGRLAEDGASVAGEFRQGGGKLAFSMKRGVDPLVAARAALEGFDARVEALLKDFETPGLALAVVRRGGVVATRGYGRRELGRDEAVTSKTLFAIGSTTKAFTAFGLECLAAEGKLDLDRPVREYLPGFALEDPVACEAATLRDMLCHRTGLPRHDLVWYNALDLDLAGIARRLRHLEPNAGFRETWQYNNLMYATAGHVGALVAGGDWEALTRRTILEPAGMSATLFSTEEARAVADHATPHARRGDDVVPIAFRRIRNVGPAGAILSNAEDLGRWLRLLVGRGELEGRRLLPEDRFDDMITPRMAMGTLPDSDRTTPTAYAMGWMVDSYRGRLRVHHNGAIDGFVASVAFFPRHDLGIAVVANGDGSPVVDLVAGELVDRIMGFESEDRAQPLLAQLKRARRLEKESEERERADRVAGTQPPRPLADYAASYLHPAYGEVAVRASEGSLAFTFHGISAPLEHWHYEVFRAGEDPVDPAWKGLKLQFRPDVTGRVEALEIALEAAVAPIRFERAPDPRLRDPAHLARFAGSYRLAGRTVTVEVAGTELRLTVPGQPTYALEPGPGGRFSLKGLDGFSVQFEEEPAGTVARVVFRQPNGIFSADRVEGN